MGLKSEEKVLHSDLRITYPLGSSWIKVSGISTLDAMGLKLETLNRSLNFLWWYKGAENEEKEWRQRIIG